MNPEKKVFWYFALIVLFSLLCLVSSFLAVAHHSFLLMAMAVVLIVITTFFASSSKFAKEVKWIRRWHRVTGCPVAEYPQTAAQRVVVRRRLYPSLHERGMALNDAIDRWGAAKARGASPEEIAALEVEIRCLRAGFLVLWYVLRHVKALPLNLETNRPWKGTEFEDFLKSIKRIADFMLPNATLSVVCA